MRMSPIEECVMCGCKDVPNKEIEMPVNVNGILSMKVLGAECSQCKEQYFDSADIDPILELIKAQGEHAATM